MSGAKMERAAAHMLTTKVLLADDHAVVAQGLESLLKKSFDLVGVVHDGHALVDAAEKLRPDVIRDRYFHARTERTGCDPPNPGAPAGRQNSRADHAPGYPVGRRGFPGGRIRLRPESVACRGTRPRDRRGSRKEEGT